MKIIVTGGYGFIGSNLIKMILRDTNYNILNIDMNSHQSMPESLDKYKKNKRYSFKKIDIRNIIKLRNVINDYKPDGIFHLAAESHVDRSIINPSDFITSNIIGTFNLLHTCNEYLKNNNNIKKIFRFIHVSTDEVYGSLKKNEPSFKEDNRIKPNSPYSASKASSDLLVRSWYKTYNFPTIITHCSNNFGPWQFPEKLIPTVIHNIVTNNKIPVYGNGKNIRDWIFVEDHNLFLLQIFKKGKIGETYNIGSNNELSNIDLISKICIICDSVLNLKKSSINLISYVNDRPGHDFRYSIDNKKITRITKIKPKYSLDHGLDITIKWYIENRKWMLKRLNNIKK